MRQEKPTVFKNKDKIDLTTTNLDRLIEEVDIPGLISFARHVREIGADELAEEAEMTVTQLTKKDNPDSKK